MPIKVNAQQSHRKQGVTSNVGEEKELHTQPTYAAFAGKYINKLKGALVAALLFLPTAQGHATTAFQADLSASKASLPIGQVNLYPHPSCPQSLEQSLLCTSEEYWNLMPLRCKQGGWLWETESLSESESESLSESEGIGGQDSEYEATTENSFATDFTEVQPGDFCFFRNMNKYSHLAIYVYQKHWEQLPAPFNDVTHVGIVTERTADTITIAEASGRGKKLNTITYKLQDLHDGEELLFVSPSSFQIPTSKYSFLQKTTSAIAQLWGKLKPNILGGDYNVEGLLFKPFIENQQLVDQVQRNLAEGVIDVLLENNRMLELSDMKAKDFFCSEFAQTVYQVASILSENSPEIFMDFMTSVTSTPRGREAGIEFLKDKIESLIPTKETSSTPLWEPPQQSSPAKMLSGVLKQGAIKTVRNPESNPKFPDTLEAISQLQESFYEHFLTRMLYSLSSGKELSSEDQEHLGKILEHFCGYSQESLNCVLKQFKEKNTELENIIEGCLSETLSPKEKFYIFLTYLGMDHAIDNLLGNDAFLKEIRSPVSQNLHEMPEFIEEKVQFYLKKKGIELTTEELLRDHAHIRRAILFLVDHFIEKPELPSGEFHTKTLELLFPSQFWTSSIFRILLDKAEPTYLTCKYLPLATVYSPPSKKLEAFLQRENISSKEFGIKLSTFLLKMYSEELETQRKS